MERLKSLLPSIEETKLLTGLFLLGLVVFTSIMLYRIEFVDPVADASYADIYGVEDENNE